ncbi:MAG: thioredoxin [Flavobacteriaceae bacterium]|jgi:thioredoxin 1|nr:MAG: thioredoxin [Polaribacter sp. BACL8 MAG-120531-bin13]KRP01568.1 MAG: thioredoxin [Polaribacter sp. BACL8 MAG-120619-bin41]MCO4780318.1 thioredoxin [Flavobacteriaceae bacterium]MCO4854761.1 thioredoxin [Flavobacteriaceae bacterium]MDP5025017.1 thioredoxin [Flavobacteriaceae bacterium]
MASFSDIINKDTPVLIDFFATWCGPCKAMSPILDDLKKQMGEQVSIVKIDVDKNPGVAAKYQVRGVPTLIIFKSGEQLWRQSGVYSAHDLKAILNQYL